MCCALLLCISRLMVRCRRINKKRKQPKKRTKKRKSNQRNPRMLLRHRRDRVRGWRRREAAQRYLPSTLARSARQRRLPMFSRQSPLADQRAAAALVGRGMTMDDFDYSLSAADAAACRLLLRNQLFAAVIFNELFSQELLSSGWMKANGLVPSFTSPRTTAILHWVSINQSEKHACFDVHMICRVLLRCFCWR